MRHVAVGTGGTHARAIGEIDGGLELGKEVVPFVFERVPEAARREPFSDAALPSPFHRATLALM